MKVEVLYIAECPHHKPAVEQAREALRAAGMPEIVEELQVHTKADAEACRFLGSPTVRVNGLDLEPEARGVQHFGFGCRSYLENGVRSGSPSRDLIQRALQENSGLPTRPMQPDSLAKKGPESTVGSLQCWLRSVALARCSWSRSASAAQDRQSLQTRALSPLVHRCSPDRTGSGGPPHLPPLDLMRTRRGLRLAGDTPHVQGSLRSSYCPGHGCDGLPLPGPLFLLTIL